MLTKRIIPCLDVKEGRVVKGINFKDLRDAGDPAELAELYQAEGADELVLLDISASEEKRRTMARWVENVADRLTIPFTVGGGIGSLDQARELISIGADKISLNTAAIENRDLISRCADYLGSQAVVVAIDVKKHGDRWKVFTHGGKNETPLDGLDWIEQVEKKGCGEILLTSMDGDGTRDGYDLDLITQACNRTSVPIIASGGAGNAEHMALALEAGAQAALAASIFHYGVLRIQEVKNYLRDRGLPIRMGI